MSVNTKMTALADQVRTLSGGTGVLGIDAMTNAVKGGNDEIGGQSDLIAQISAALEGKAVPGGGITPTGTIEITENGTHDVTEYATAEVNVPSKEPVLQEGSATPTNSQQTFNPPSGVDGFSKFVVEKIPDQYIVPEGSLDITKNGEHDISEYASVNVNVPDVPAVVDVLEVTENGAYNAADDGLDGFSVVTVNVPDTPAVVEELNVTENGTYEPGNGVDGFSKVTVNVASSGGGETQVYGFLNNTITAIDSDVTSVVAYACRGLSKIKTVKVPNATSIGTYAFYYCTAMTSINAPKVTSLGTYAFYNCAIKSVNFPLATSVPSQCFYSCSSLTKADFGVASSIAASAFAYAGIEALILRRTSGICSLSNKNALVDTPIEKGTGYVYVHRTLDDGRDGPTTYAAATNWSTYQFRAIEDYPDICGTGG